MTDTKYFRAFRFALDPTVAQRQNLARQVGATRWAFNHEGVCMAHQSRGVTEDGVPEADARRQVRVSIPTQRAIQFTSNRGHSVRLHHDVNARQSRLDGYRRLMVPRIGSIRLHDSGKRLARYPAGTVVRSNPSPWARSKGATSRPRRQRVIFVPVSSSDRAVDRAASPSPVLHTSAQRLFRITSI